MLTETICFKKTPDDARNFDGFYIHRFLPMVPQLRNWQMSAIKLAGTKSVSVDCHQVVYPEKTIVLHNMVRVFLLTFLPLLLLKLNLLVYKVFNDVLLLIS